MREKGSINSNYLDVQLLDVTGSSEAGFALMFRIGIGIEDWSYYRVETDLEERISADGPYSMSFNQPGVVIHGTGWTAPAAILDTILSSREWLLMKDIPLEGDDPQDRRFQFRFQPSECDDVTFPWDL